MWNALSHLYADVDLGTVWNTAWNDLPVPEQQLSILSRGCVRGG